MKKIHRPKLIYCTGFPVFFWGGGGRVYTLTVIITPIYRPVFDVVEQPPDSTYHELHQCHTSSAGADVITPASASAGDRLHSLDTHTARSVLATSTDVACQPSCCNRAPGSGPLLPGYQDSCSSGSDQRPRGCGGGGGGVVPGTVGPQAVETW